MSRPIPLIKRVVFRMRFSHFGKRVVFAAFDGGEITSDAGVLFRCEQARRIRLFERMADCFSDRRDPTRTVHGPAGHGHLSDISAFGTN